MARLGPNDEALSQTNRYCICNTSGYIVNLAASSQLLVDRPEGSRRNEPPACELAEWYVRRGEAMIASAGEALEFEGFAGVRVYVESRRAPGTSGAKSVISLILRRVTSQSTSQNSRTDCGERRRRKASERGRDEAGVGAPARYGAVGAGLAEADRCEGNSKTRQDVVG